MAAYEAGSDGHGTSTQSRGIVELPDAGFLELSVNDISLALSGAGFRNRRNVLPGKSPDDSTG